MPQGELGGTSAYFSYPERGMVSASCQISLAWQRFPSMHEAAKAFKCRCCTYVIFDQNGRPLYIGPSGGKDGLEGRYRGGPASAMDAALHGSGNHIFVAPFSGPPREAVEKALIYWEQPQYNRQGIIINLGDLSQSSPIRPDSVIHSGDTPSFDCLDKVSKNGGT